MTLHLKASTSAAPLPKSDEPVPDRRHDDDSSPNAEDSKPSTSCLLCGTSYFNVQEQRQHVRSDWHNYNLKQKLRGGKAVVEIEFEKLLEDLNESLSGSGSSSSESEDGDGQNDSTLSALLKKQAKLSNGIGEEEDFMPKKRKRGAGKPPLLWFTSSLLSSNTSLGVYRALFTATEQEQPDVVNVLNQKQLPSVPVKPPPMADTSNGVPLPSTMTSPSLFMCMVGGGHFAGMIVSLTPKIGKQSTGPGEQRQAIVMAHKTFHRYTTRRKQGGGQSANDSAKGAAHSAGSSLRRYNEVALEQEIRALLSEWRDMISNAQLIFVRATGSSNRRILFGPYEGQVLHHNDPRNRTFPFSTRRATQAELMRSFVELTRVKVSEVDEAALAAAAAEAEEAATTSKSSSTTKPAAATAAPPKPSKEDEEAALHTGQLTALIRRSKAPALLSYLSTNALPTEYAFFPPDAQAHHHAPTPLHLAASTNSSACVAALLVKAGADPTLRNGEGRTAFELCGERATRDAFRVARHELGEGRWEWSEARVPEGMSKAEAEKRGERERADAEKRESERRKGEEERLAREGPKVEDRVRQGGSVLGLSKTVQKTAEEKREEEARGLTPEMRQRMERERRARAAEARFAKR